MSLLPISHYDLIVIGGGVAGIQGALEAKKLQPKKSVALISDEIEMYSRPSLTAVISGVVNNVDRIGIFSQQTLNCSDIHLFPRQEISEIEHSLHTVRVRKKGQKQSVHPSNITYDKLVVATGGKPVIPKTEGVRLPGVFTIRKFEEALAASRFMSSGMTAYVVGAGFVGLDAAETLAHRGLRVTLVVRSRILRGILEQDLSETLVERAKNHRVRVLSGVTLERIEGNQKVERVVTDGETLKADVVIFATGVEPETKLAQSMGLVTSQNGAIKTDTKMQTNQNGVYATGDCSESIDFVSRKSAYRPLGSIAALTAQIAAANAIGVEKTYDGIIRRQYNRIFGTEIVSVGLSTEEAKSFGIRAKEFNCMIKKPELLSIPQLVLRNLMRVIVNEDTNVIIGWQVVGIRQSSLFYHYFYDCIFHRRRLEDVRASGLRIELVFEQK